MTTSSKFSGGVCPTRLLFVMRDPVAIGDVLRAVCYRLGGWDCQFVSTLPDALDRIGTVDYHAVISDLDLREHSGLDLLSALRRDSRTKAWPVVLLTRPDETAARRSALEMGVTEFVSKPVDRTELLVRLDTVIRVKAYRDALRFASTEFERKVQQRTAALEASRRDAIYYLARAAESRDDDTGNHILRVAHFSGALADALGMDRGFVDRLTLAASLHDIGKIGISDAILRKPGALTVDERAAMQDHCSIGARILGEVPALAGLSHGTDDALLNQARAVALGHHERWDGTGYPHRLAGEAIPLEARIVAVADVYDALRTARPYKKAMDVVRAINIMASSAGTHFDPAVYATFEQILPRLEEIRASFQDTPLDLAA